MAAKEAKLVTSHVEAVPEVDEAVAAWPVAVMGDAGSALKASLQGRPDLITHLTQPSRQD